MHNLPKVSVIIPTYNSVGTLIPLVRALEDQDHPDFEIIVIDDKSTDNTQELLAGIDKVNVVCNSDNQGPAYSRNRGIENSSGDILVLIDSDSIVDDRSLLSKHAIAHKTTTFHILGGGIQGVGESVFAKADNFNHWMLNIPNSDNIFRTHLVTNNMSFTRRVFEVVGRFDENLRTGEDTDFCERALCAGFKIGLDTTIVLKHKDRELFKDFAGNLFTAGLDRIPARRGKGHRLSYVLPFGPISGVLYWIPLAVAITVQIIYYWFSYDKRVLIYAPIIFIGSLAEAGGIMAYCLGVTPRQK